MAYTFFSDNFTGTAGADLTGHTPAPTDFGSVVWDDFATLFSLAPWKFRAGGGIVAPAASAYSRIDLAGSPASTTIRFTLNSTDASGGLLLQFRRTDVSGNTNFEVAFDYGAGAVQVSKAVAGTTTNGPRTDVTFAAATDYAVAVTLATSGGSTTLTLTIGGTAIGTPFVVSDAGLQASAFLVFGSAAGTGADTLSVDDLILDTPSATALTVTGPGSITVGTASGNYTVATNGSLPVADGGFTFTPTTSGFSATPTPSTVSFAAGSTSHTFTETASTAGTGTVSGTAPGMTVTGASVTSASGGGGGSTVTGVTVTPPTATVAGGATQAFSATVAGTGSPSQSVTWSADLGTFSGSTYTAPAATSSIQTATVTATSVQDTSKSGTATVTVPVAGTGPAVLNYLSAVGGLFASGLSTVGYQLYADGSASGSRTTSGVAEQPAGSGNYRAIAACPAGSLVMFAWDDGAGVAAVDANPQCAPGASSSVAALPSTAPVGWLVRASFADDMKVDGTMRSAPTGAVLHLDADDRMANGMILGSGAVNQMLLITTGSDTGDLIPIASVAAGSGGVDATILGGYTPRHAIDATSGYFWTGQPALAVDPQAVASAVFSKTGQLGDGSKTFSQTMTKAVARLVGEIDDQTTPGTAVFKKADGTGTAYVQQFSATRRQPHTPGSGL